MTQIWTKIITTKHEDDQKFQKHTKYINNGYVYVEKYHKF